MRAGDLRRHRRPVPQEADAGRLRPRQPRAAAAGLLARRVRPPRLGGRGLRAGRARLGARVRPDAVPRGGLAAARRGHAFIPGDFDDDVAFKQLAATVDELDASRGTSGNYAFYLSVPPKFFPKVVQQLKKHGLADAPEGSWRRAVIEKPFGHDLASAQELNALVHEVFAPEQVFRIDHYLGKETVQNILALRFANPMFEPIWNRSLRRPRADHDGRGHRHRWPRRLLRRHRRRTRRHPEPPPPAAGADRDGGARRLRRRVPAHREAEGAERGEAPRATWASTPYAASTRAGWQGGEEVRGYLEEDGIDPRVQHRHLRRRQAGDRQPPLGGRPLLPADRQAARPPRHGDRGRLPARPALPVRPDATEELGRTRSSSASSPTRA